VTTRHKWIILVISAGLKLKMELSFAGRLATLLVLAIVSSAGKVLVLEGVLKT
jgi:hypothetical protein